MNTRGPIDFAISGAATLAIVLGLQSAGAAAQVCMEDADCPMGFECDLAPRVCSDVPGGVPECPPAEGECEPAPIACERDADCPFGLRCEADESDASCVDVPSGDGGGEPSGNCEEPEPGADEAYCVYELVECSSDSACEAGHACQPLGEQTCVSRPSPCAPGEACAPGEEVCTERETSFCFPVRRDCARDDDCRPDWKCASLSEDAQDHPPPGFEGASRICVPEGLALVLSGHVEVSRSSGSSARKSGQASNSALAAGEPGHTAGSSGCSVGDAARGGPHFAAGSLAVGLFLVSRRGRLRRRPTARNPC